MFTNIKFIERISEWKHYRAKFKIITDFNFEYIDFLQRFQTIE